MAGDVIAIGASAGGVQAVRLILAELPSDIAAGVLVVIHRSRDSVGLLGAALAIGTRLRVVEVDSRMRLEHGTVYVAPADRHLMIASDMVAASSDRGDVKYRPSVDVLFRSAAAAFGERVIGVVLTGYGDDGTAGLHAIKAAGGVTVVQDPVSAAYGSMPLSALRAARADHCVPLESLAALLVSLTS